MITNFLANSEEVAIWLGLNDGLVQWLGCVVIKGYTQPMGRGLSDGQLGSEWFTLNGDKGDVVRRGGSGAVGQPARIGAAVVGRRFFQQQRRLVERRTFVLVAVDDNLLLVLEPAPLKSHSWVDWQLDPPHALVAVAAILARL